MNTFVTIGRNIKTFREKLGYSQENLAIFLNVQREMVSYYENGKRNIPIKHLDKIADLFGLELDELLEEEIEIGDTNIAFAFRTDDINSYDLQNIALFKRVVLNYLKMRNLNT